MARILLISVFALLFVKQSLGQVITNNSAGDLLLNAMKFKQTDSGLYLIQVKRNACKTTSEESFFIPNPEIPLVPRQAVKMTAVTKTPFVTVHGNVTYNFNYRSYIDTPFAENDIMQHAVQARLNLKLKDSYPFTVFLTSRRSNSPYFSNATDVSVQFRQADMLENIKKKMRAQTDSLLYNRNFQLTPAQIYQREKEGSITDIGKFSAPDGKELAGKYAIAKSEEAEQKFKKLYGDYKEKMDKLNALQQWSKHTSRSQELVEEKEKKLRGMSAEISDSLENLAGEYAVRAGKKYFSKTDSTAKGAQQAFTEKQQEIDKLRKDIAVSEKELKSFQKKMTDSLQKVKKLIASITDKNALYEYLQQQGRSTRELPAMQRVLLSVKQVGLGRSWIDYSELTVKNISLSGVNVEMNPGNIYFAAAAGKVNYRFRDYIIKGDYAGSGQSVGLIRAGFGNKEKSNFIITYYAGKKAMLNQRTLADSAAVQRISGISVESKVAIDANNYLIGEYARSASPDIKGKIFNFKSSTNEAWSVKLYSNYVNTKVTGYYRHTGEGFQSFTLYPTNNKQDAWMMRVNQAVWKKRILLDAAVRKNDFESPIAAPDFSNKNIFKSFQATVRIPKYPFVSVGYYPSSQLTLSNNEVLYENRYNTLNAIASHSYFLKGISMNSNATYTKFYNQGSDSGFLYYNASTFTFNHSVNVKAFVFQGILTLTDQSLLSQLTLEPVVTYQVKNRLSLSGSVKWSRVNHVQTLWGGTAGANVYLGRIGVIQLQYDKIFLPGYNRNLLPVDMGRLTFSREF